MVSQKISTKDYTPNNFRKEQSGAAKVKFVTRGNNAEVESEQLFDEIKSLQEFQRAFFFLGVLRKRVLTIDCSLEPLQLFLIDRSYFQDECDIKGFGRGPKITQGSFCAMFADNIIRINNERFDKKFSFITYAEMDAEYSTFCQADVRLHGHVPKFFGHQNESENKPRHFQKQQIRQNNKNNDICYHFNSDSCTKTLIDNNSKCKDRSGVVRRHLCNFAFKDGNVCAKPHMKLNHTGFRPNQ